MLESSPSFQVVVGSLQEISKKYEPDALVVLSSLVDLAKWPRALSTTILQGTHLDVLCAFAAQSEFKPSHNSLLALDESSKLSVVLGFLPKHEELFPFLCQARKLADTVSDRYRRNILIDLSGLSDSLQIQQVDALTAAFTARDFRPEKYGKKAEEAKKNIPKKMQIKFRVAPSVLEQCRDISAIAFESAVSNNLVRWLTIAPANRLNPTTYVAKVKEYCRTCKLEFSFMNTKALAARKAGAFLAVAQGAKNQDAGIVHIKYRPTKKAAKKLTLVGKGIVYDTGGVNVKPAAGMFGMQGDMMGSAIALALIMQASREKWPFQVDAYLAIAENSISEIAYRPNEIVIAANGASIETVHTDAEGRMVLADTLYFASHDKPDVILDFATLTGAAVNAIGTNYSAVFSNRGEWYPMLIDAGKKTGERVWPFPMDEDYGECLDSEIADTKQCRLKGGVDHIEAAVFLSKFIEADVPWIHMDLSASDHDGGLGCVPTKETGFGVRVAREIIFRILT